MGLLPLGESFLEFIYTTGDKVTYDMLSVAATCDSS